MNVQTKPIVRTIPATEARIHFGDVLKRVYRGEEQLIVEKDGLPVAVILSNADFQQYQRLLALQQLDQLNRGVNRQLRANKMTEEEALADHKNIKKKFYRGCYGRATPKRPKAR